MLSKSELATKFERAGDGFDVIAVEDLQVIGITEINEHVTWEGFCQYVYRVITGEDMSACHLTNIQERFAFFGYRVALALRRQIADEEHRQCNG